MFQLSINPKCSKKFITLTTITATASAIGANQNARPNEKLSNFSGFRSKLEQMDKRTNGQSVFKRISTKTISSPHRRQPTTPSRKSDFGPTRAPRCLPIFVIMTFARTRIPSLASSSSSLLTKTFLAFQILKAGGQSTGVLRYTQGAYLTKFRINRQTLTQIGTYLPSVLILLNFASTGYKKVGRHKDRQVSAQGTDLTKFRITRQTQAQIGTQEILHVLIVRISVGDQLYEYQLKYR